MTYDVSVHASGERRLEVRYTPEIVELWRLGDAGVDGIDEDSDWWTWLGRVVAKTKPRDALVSRWSAGM